MQEYVINVPKPPNLVDGRAAFTFHMSLVLHRVMHDYDIPFWWWRYREETKERIIFEPCRLCAQQYVHTAEAIVKVRASDAFLCRACAT